MFSIIRSYYFTKYEKSFAGVGFPVFKNLINPATKIYLIFLKNERD